MSKGGVGSIPVALLPSCQDIKTVALQLLEYLHRCVVKKTPQSHYSRQNTGLGQYNSLGEYSGPHSDSSVFLILKILFWQRPVL